MTEKYPIRAAARLTEIAVDTLRAWERRYRAVSPARTKRGRFYSEGEIRRLLLLRSAVESGRAIGQVASLSDAQLEELDRKARSFSSKRETPTVAEDTPAPLRPLLNAIESYDYAAANDEFGRLALLMRPTELVYGVVLPLMRIAGEKWESGVFPIAQEHMLSACVRNLLGGLVRLLRQKADHGGGSLLFTTLSNELHEFGILAAAMLAVEQGFQVAYLGPNLPAREVLLAVEHRTPRAVVLGIMKVNATPSVRDDVRRLASKLPEAAELWLGGGGAAQVSKGLQRDGLIVLEDHRHFERHLARLRAMPLRQSI